MNPDLRTQPPLGESPTTVLDGSQPGGLKQLAYQFIKFALVGGSGVLVNMLVMVLLHRMHGGPEYANQPLINIPGTDFWIRYRNVVFIVSFLVANVWNYCLNRRITFERTGRAWWRDFWPFLGAGAIAAVIGLVLQILFTHPQSPIYLPDPPFETIGTWRSRELWAQLFGVLVSTPVNFVINKLWAFRKRERSDAPTP
ncbi:MAG: GtrA family protein [Propionibacteriaceae bacterium]|nr:GtrA family protein [Propionibacteriaceae bacterium]